MMKSFLEYLFYNYEAEKEYNEAGSKVDAEIAVNKKRLKRNLDKKQKRYLLRIIDAKDLLKEESNLESFSAGFKMGLQVGYESNKS